MSAFSKPRLFSASRSSFCLRLKDNRTSSDGFSHRLQVLADATGELADPDTQQALYNLMARYSGKTPFEFAGKGIELVPASKAVWRGDTLDGSGQLPVFILHGEDFATAWIETGNAMGVVKIADSEQNIEVQLSIGSRFDTSNRQHFLNHMLSRVFAGSWASDMDSGPDSFWELLLAILFHSRLLEASRIGLFRQYRHISHHDIRFRGSLDIGPYIRRDIPFIGRLSYSNHEIALDNPLNQLVRHACARVIGKWPSLFLMEKPLIDYIHELERETPSWQKRNPLACMARNQRPVKHPYYHATYEPLRKLALIILRSEGINPYSESEQVDGILFDGAWLWEEYLWTLLAPLGYSHPSNKTRMGSWRVLDETFYPDFFFLQENRPRVVLDAKYKGERQDQRDMLQVSGYMYMLEARIGGLIKPVKKSIRKEYKWDLVPDHSSRWHVLGLSIPDQAKNSQDFHHAIGCSEQRLIAEIEELG